LKLSSFCDSDRCPARHVVDLQAGALSSADDSLSEASCAAAYLRACAAGLDPVLSVIAEECERQWNAAFNAWAMLKKQPPQKKFRGYAIALAQRLI
jgi:hypothetical protein